MLHACRQGYACDYAVQREPYGSADTRNIVSMGVVPLLVVLMVAGDFPVFDFVMMKTEKPP